MLSPLEIDVARLISPPQKTSRCEARWAQSSASIDAPTSGANRCQRPENKSQRFSIGQEYARTQRNVCRGSRGFSCPQIRGHPVKTSTTKRCAAKPIRDRPSARLLRTQDFGYVPLDGPLQELVGVLQMQLLLDARSVSLHGAHIDVQGGGDLGSAGTHSYQFENL